MVIYSNDLEIYECMIGRMVFPLLLLGRVLLCLDLYHLSTALILLVLIFLKISYGKRSLLFYLAPSGILYFVAFLLRWCLTYIVDLSDVGILSLNQLVLMEYPYECCMTIL